VRFLAGMYADTIGLSQDLRRRQNIFLILKFVHRMRGRWGFRTYFRANVVVVYLRVFLLGTSSFAESSSCFYCNNGTFSAAKGSPKCSTCHPGRVTSAVGAFISCKSCSAVSSLQLLASTTFFLIFILCHIKCFIRGSTHLITRFRRNMAPWLCLCLRFIFIFLFSPVLRVPLAHCVFLVNFRL
jgi:hypothetical protein